MIYTSGVGAVRGAARVQIADRDYFRKLRDTSQSGLVFSDVITSFFDGGQRVIAARALRDEQGAFRGVVFAALELAHFKQLFQPLDLGAQGSIALRRTDNHKLVLR